MILIDDVEISLLLVWNLSCHEFYTQNIFVWFFQQSMPKCVQYFKSTIDNIVYFFLI